MRFLNNIFYFLFLFILTFSIRSESTTLSQDDIAKLQTLLDQSKQNILKEDEKEQSDKIIEDSNFKLIIKVQDQIREILDSRHDILIQKPDWSQKDICDILRILTSSEFYKDIITDFNLFKDLENALNDISVSYPKFSKELRCIIDMFRMIDYLTKKEKAFLEKIQSFPNAKIMSESSINEELNSLFLPLMEYTPDTSKTLIRNLIIKFVKIKFGTSPRIPSYVIFGILNCMNEALKDQFEKFETTKKQFTRKLDSLTDITNELLKEIKDLKTSDKIAQNIVIYLDCLEKCITEINESNQNARKSFNEYSEKISTVYSELSSPLEECLNSPKNPEIFDFLEKN